MPRGLSVRIIPFLQDNYAYLLRCDRTGACALVDPADPERARHECENERKTDPRMNVTHLLCTHKHHDHSGGNAELVRGWPGVKVVSGDGVEKQTVMVKHGDVVKVGELRIHVLEVPCHTTGHVAFLCNGCLFSGDFLFSAGAGKFFEGNAKDFVESVRNSIEELPDETLMFPGHEYTVTNLDFAWRLDPTNDETQTRLAWAKQQREAAKFTIPSSLGDERKFNPFLRACAGNVALGNRVAGLVESLVASPNGVLTVSAGSDRTSSATREIRSVDPNDKVQVVRAIRALKDRGGLPEPGGSKV